MSPGTPIPLRLPQGAREQLAVGSPQLNFVNAVLVGTLLMSPMGWAWLLKFGPNYYPEVAILAIFLLNASLSKNFSKDLLIFFQSRFVQAWTLGIFTLAAIGVIFTKDIFATYSDFRACLALGYAASFAQRIKPNILRGFVLDTLMCALLATATFYLIAPSGSLSSKQPFCITGALAAFYLSAKYRNMLYVTAASALTVYLAVTSSFRSNLAIAAILLLLFIWVGLFPITSHQDARKKIQDRIIFIAFAIAAQVFAPLLIAFGIEYINADASRHHQIVYKTAEMMDALKAGHFGRVDTLRAGYIPYIQENFGEFLLPSGLGYKGWQNNWHSMWSGGSTGIFGSSLDGGHLYLSLHFGIIASTALLFWVGAKWYAALKQARWSETLLRLGLFAQIALFMSAFGGLIFTQLGFALGSGILFGLLCRK